MEARSHKCPKIEMREEGGGGSLKNIISYHTDLAITFANRSEYM